MEQLRRLRIERGLSQAKLATKAGVDKATVNQIETGARKPRGSTMEKLASALEVEMAELYRGYELPPKAQAPLPDFNEERRDSGAEAYAVLGERLAEDANAELEEWRDVLQRDLFSGRNKIIGWNRKAGFHAWAGKLHQTFAAYIDTAHKLAPPAGGVLVAMNLQISLMTEVLELQKEVLARSESSPERDRIDRAFWELAKNQVEDARAQLQGGGRDA